MAAQTPTCTEAAAPSLTMAIIAASPGPLMLLDGDLNIVAASASFSEVFQVDATTALGTPLSSLGGGEWDVPQLRSLLDATRSGAAKIEAYEMDLKRRGRETRRLVIHVERLVYLDLENPRLLMAVLDVTDARAAEAATATTLRENLVLLQEVRHRVANSLQIIASVLLQNARKTRSDETRGHLKDAHHRVMSVAALERQLAGSGEPHVELRAYLTNLCDSIAASMIADTDHLSLVVGSAKGTVDARVSTCLGLIVTELVINALKHAFPEGRPGRITVACDVHGPNWTLSVSDDGVGMPSDPAQVHVGLGTGIVQALARQLSATVETAPARPGLCVTVNHTQVALLDDGAVAGAAAAVVSRPAAQSH